MPYQQQVYSTLSLFLNIWYRIGSFRTFRPNIAVVGVERYSECATYLYMFDTVDLNSEVMLIFSIKDSTKHLFHVPQSPFKYMKSSLCFCCYGKIC